ncbi:MAG: hypothetical protein ACR2PO_06935 [Methyloligellaceae bacterium]
MMAARADVTWPRDAAILVLALLVTFVLPIAIYGLLSWKQFAFFRLTYFIPFEEIRAGLAAPTFDGLYALPLIQMNMTSGHLLSNMYTLTLGQLALSLTLGSMIGLVLIGHLRLRGLCAAGGARGTGAAASAGAGLFSTVAASSTGLLGCCGSALAGGVLALAGLTSTTAAQVAQASPLIQLALIGVFTWQLVRLRRRKRAVLGENAPIAASGLPGIAAGPVRDVLVQK